MLNKSDKRLKAYYKEIKRKLSCPREEKKKLLEMISGSVEAYIEEHPEADFDALLENFGSAKDIAEAYRAEDNSKPVWARNSTPKLIILIVASALLIALLIWGLAILIAKLNAAGIYAEVIITEHN